MGSSGIKQLETQYRSMSAYRDVGSKMSKMGYRSHCVQRSNHMNADAYRSGASAKAKKEFVDGVDQIVRPRRRQRQRLSARAQRVRVGSGAGRTFELRWHGRGGSGLEWR